MRGPESRESGVGPTPATPNPINSLPAFTALNLHNVIKAAPPLQHHPDLASSVASAGGDVTQNAQSAMGFKILHDAINTSLSSVGNDFHWHFRNIADSVQQEQQDAARRAAIESNAQSAYAAKSGSDLSRLGEVLAETIGGKAPLPTKRPLTPLEQESDILAKEGLPQAEISGQTFEQTIGSKVADATGRTADMLPPGWDGRVPKTKGHPQPTGLWGTVAKALVTPFATQDAEKTVVSNLPEVSRLSVQRVNNPTHGDIIRQTVDALFNSLGPSIGTGMFGRDSTSHARLEEAARTATDFTVRSLINTFTGTLDAKNKQTANTFASLRGQDTPYPGYDPSGGMAFATVQGATGAVNIGDFLKNTQEQFKYLYWVYKNKGEVALYDAVAPIVLGALVGGASGWLLRSQAIEAELSAIRAGATEAEAAANARAVLQDAVTSEDGGPLNARPHAPVNRPETTPSNVRGENTYPDYAPKAKAGEVRNGFVTAAEMNGSTSGVTLPNSVASSVKEAINQALNDLWNAVDKGHWAGLKSNPSIVHDIHSMTDYGETALNNRLAEMRAANPNMTDAEFDVAHRAAQRVMADKVNEFHDLGKANFEAGKTYRGASWVGQKAIQGSKVLKAALKPIDALSRNDAWSGAQVMSYAVNPNANPDWWQQAQSQDIKSIGQMFFGGFPLSGVTSGIADAFVALTSGPVPVGHLFARGGVAGEATNITAEEVDRAWAQGFGIGTFRNALRQMEGRTPGEVVQMFRELAASADAQGNSIASKLAMEDENGKLVFGAPEDTYKRFRALTVGESYASLAKLPTTSIYGYLRAGKVDGGKFINWMSRTFGRMPFTIDEMGHLVNRAIQYNDPQAPNLVADMLRTVGYDHNEVNAIVDKMLANPQDTKLWQDTVQGAIKDVMAGSVSKNLNRLLGGVFDVENLLKALKEDRKWLKDFEDGKVELTPQQQEDLRRWIAEKEAIIGPHEPMLRELYKQIDNASKELVGAPGPTPVGAYAFKHAYGHEAYIDISTLDSGSKGGVGLKQTGIMYIPSYKDINQVMYDIVHWSARDNAPIETDLAKSMSAGNRAAYWTMHRPQMASEWINRVFNNAFFKPLALLTGGWATRVSMSELAINTPRHGLRDMTAGFASQNLIKQQEIANWRITQKVASKADMPEVDRFAGPFPTGGNTTEHLIYDPSAPGMRTVVGAQHDAVLKREAELDKRVANNIANRTKFESDRARGAVEGVVDRLISDNNQNFMRSVIRKYGSDVSPETAAAFKEETRNQIEEVNKFVRAIGTKMFDVGPDGGVRISNIFRADISSKMADYDFASNTVRIFGGAYVRGNVTHSTIHELWHMLSQYVDESQIKNLENEVIKARSKFLAKNDIFEFAKRQINHLPEDEQKFKEAIRGMGDHYVKEMKFWYKLVNDPELANFVRQNGEDMHAFWNEVPMSYLGTNGYRLRNVDEWFAENLTDMYSKYDSVTNPLIRLAHRLMDMFWSTMSKVVGVGQSRAIFVDFLKKRYSEADWNFGSLQYRGGISNADFAEMKDGANAWRITSPESINSKITAKYGATQAVQGLKNSALDSAVAREISLVVRGMMSGVDQTILAGIGKAEFADAAIELMWKHDGYLPDSVGAIHNSPYREIELSQYDRQIHYTRRGRVKTPRTRLVGTGGNYIGVSFGGQGYFAGWQNMARWISEDDILYRPVANIYRDLYDTGLRGEQLRLAAIDRTEAFLRSQPNHIIDRVERSEVPHSESAYIDNPMRSWAEAKVDNLEYTVHGWKGEIGAAENGAHFHGKLLDDIADGNIPHDLNTFIRKYATRDNGRMMPHSMMPHSTVSPQVDVWNMGEGGGWINSLASRGHQKILGPVVNHMTRNPLYIVNYVNASKKIAPLVEQGLITADQASVMAEIRATRDMLPTIHNPLDKTKFEEMLTTAFPFYFAQNQAWRRMGRLFATDPGAFMQYFISMSAVTQAVQNITKNSGLGVVAIPLTLLLFGVPLTASLTSMAVIDPFSTPSDTRGQTSPLSQAMEMFGPHAGWVPQVLGHLVLLDAPEWMKPLGSGTERNLAQNQMLVGPIGSSENFIDAAIPNSILKAGKQIITSYSGGNPEDFQTGGAFSAPAYIQAYTEARSSIMYEAMKKEAAVLKKSGVSNAEQRFALADYISKRFNPKIGGNDYNWLISQSRNMAHSVLWAKLAIGSFSPLSVGVGDTNPQVRKLRDKLIADPNLGFTGAINKIYQEEPYFTPEMMSKTKSTYGNNIPENRLVNDFLHSQGALVQDKPLAAWAFGPDVTKDANYFQPALQAMLDAGMRQRLTPKQMIENFFVQLGWNTYYNDVIPLAKQKAQQYQAAGITQPNGKPYTESSIRSEMEATLRKDNPYWNFNTGAKAASGQRAVEELKSLMYDSKYKDLQASHGPLIKHLQEFLDSPNGYVVHDKLQALVKSRKITSVEAKSTWLEGTITDWVARYPDLAPAMHTIFANLG